MIHRTFRSLDRPPKLVGFTIGQWTALIAGALALLALVHVTGMPAKAAITLGVFALGLPAALAYVSEAGGVRVGGLLWDAVRWRVAAKTLAAASGTGTRGAVLIVEAGERWAGRRRRRDRRGEGESAR